MGNELVQFYTNPHTGQLCLYPIEYTFLNVYSFPISFIATLSDELITRLTYLGYEQREASITGNLIWFNKLKNQIDNILNSLSIANSNKIFDREKLFLQYYIEARKSLTYKTIKDFIYNKESIFIDSFKKIAVKDKYFVFAVNILKNDAFNSNFLQLFPIVEYKDSFVFNPIYSLQQEHNSNILESYLSEYVHYLNLSDQLYKAFNSLTDTAKMLKGTINATSRKYLKTCILDSLNGSVITREIDFFINYMTENVNEIMMHKDVISDYLHQIFNSSTQIISEDITKRLLNTDNFKLKITSKNKDSNIKDKLIQSFVDTQKESILSKMFEVRSLYDNIFQLFELSTLNRSVSNRSLLTSMFSANNQETSSKIVVDQLYQGLKSFSNSTFNNEHLNLYKIDNDSSILRLLESTKSFGDAFVLETLEKFTKDLTHGQQIRSLINLTLNLKQSIFSRFFNWDNKSRDFEMLDKKMILERDYKELGIIHDILYLETIFKLSQITTIDRFERNKRNSKVVSKYHTYRRQSKVSRNLYKVIRMNKISKDSEKLAESILGVIFKSKEIYSSKMEYGCKNEHTLEELKNSQALKSESIAFINISEILTKQNKKDSILQTKDFISKKIGHEWNSISISLEAVKDQVAGYKPYIVLKFEGDEKIYFDLGYEHIESSKVDTIMEIYNRMVQTEIEYRQCYESIILQLDKFEKLILVSEISNFDIESRLSEITQDPKLLEKMVRAIINIREQIADKIKSGLNLTKYEVEKLLKSSINIDKFVLNELYHRWYFLPSDGPYDEMILPQDYPYSIKPVNGINEHPFPNGAEKANREIPVDINILTNVIDFCGNLWEANIFLYGGYTPQQALKHFVNCIFDWLDKYAPTKIDKIPEYYPDNYTIYDNTDIEREDYWRLYKWIRWYSEALVLNVPKEDEVQLLGNVYIKRLLEDLIKYFEDHHGVYGVPGTKTIDKIKGLRHKWLDKYNHIN